MQKAHFIGIKGVGMTALATILKEKGWHITGSDVGESFITDIALSNAGITVYNSFSPDNIKNDIDMVVYSGAYNENNNPEVAQSKKLGIPLKTQQEALVEAIKHKRLVAVAGVGGKTTTTAMTAYILNNTIGNTGFFVGAGKISGQYKTGGWGDNDLFIAEADEYANNIGVDNTPKLLLLNPNTVIMPNLQYDHPDIYNSELDTIDTFTKFLSKLNQNNTLYYNADNSLINRILSNPNLKHRKISVGFSEKHDWYIKSIEYDNEYTNVSIFHEGNIFELKLLLFGKHNVYNAVLASAFSHDNGIEWTKIHNALSSFSGVGRRQEFMGQNNGVLFYDDYAHHPFEVKTTIQSFKSRFPDKNIWVIFESHTYTRTTKLLDDFVDALSIADKLTIAPIFSSAREDESDFSITNKDIVKKLKDIGKNATALSFNEIIDDVLEHATDQDIVLTMGAGTIYKLHSRFVDRKHK